MTAKKILSFFLLIISLGFIATAQAADHPEMQAFPPFKIAGNLYYVGNNYVASYLIVTRKGNILINSDFAANVPMIKDSIEKLGFKFRETRILLISHAHFDHDAGSALVKDKTGATYMVMAADVPVVESGGKSDFRYGNEPQDLYQATKVDRVLHDGEKVQLGNTVLTAHLTAGHTRGCTTWTMTVNEKGKNYNVVIVGGPYVNPGYKLVNDTVYPQMAQDYEHTFQVLKTLPCDIFLGAHGSYFGLDEKYARMQTGVANPFVDPEGYKQFVTKAEQEFQVELAKQKVG